jgi:beta-glucosidase
LFQGFWQAGRADAVVLCLGINALFEGEEGDAMMNPHGGDRIDIRLPENQLEFVKRIRERVKDKPLIVVVTGGSTQAIPEIDSIADAVLFAWYPGEAGGTALADILFGEVNPSGRLPVTFYRSVNDLPDFEDYSMEGRTYKYFRGEPLYPFGYGLSYSEFRYNGLAADKEKYASADSIRVMFELTNISKIPGDEVVQVYMSRMNASDDDPNKILAGFRRVGLEAGQSSRIEFTIPVDRLAGWDSESDSYQVVSGTYSIQVCASSADVRLEKQIVIQ